MSPRTRPDASEREAGEIRLRWAVAAVPILLAGCLNHYEIHPRQPPPSISTSREEAIRGQLKLNLEWAVPPGDGPFPGVLVHPEAGHEAREMRGVVRSLALHGYVALAVDYEGKKPRGDGYVREAFVWREEGDAGSALDVLAGHPSVDPTRIGALGYSQGGVLSLLIAAEREDVRAVVAYYPVTDFELWLDKPDRPAMKRWVFKFIREYFWSASGVETEEEFLEMLARISPYRQAERIHTPVLLIHGDRDFSADIEESVRLEARLRELDRPVELLVMDGAGHVFNFKNADRARVAWDAAMDWLDTHLKGPTPGG